MKEIWEKIYALIRLGWGFIVFGFRAYHSAVDNLGSSWALMIHSTVYGSIGSMIVYWIF